MAQTIITKEKQKKKQKIRSYLLKIRSYLHCFLLFEVYKIDLL